jgi:hypothetical protein
MGESQFFKGSVARNDLFFQADGPIDVHSGYSYIDSYMNITLRLVWNAKRAEFLFNLNIPTNVKSTTKIVETLSETIKMGVLTL